MPSAGACGAEEECSPLPGSAIALEAPQVLTPFAELVRRLKMSRRPDGDWTPAEKGAMHAAAARDAHEPASAPWWDGMSCARCSIVPLEASGALKRPPGCPDASHPAAFCRACLHDGAMKIGETAEDAALLASLWCPACRES